MSSASPQESHDLALIAHLASLKAKVPFLHFFDGGLVGNQHNRIQVLPYSDIRKLHAETILSHPSVGVPRVVRSVMTQLASASGRQYQIFDYQGDVRAEFVIVGMGVAALKAQETVLALLKQKKVQKVGVLRVLLYRPWSQEHFVIALPPTTKKIAVLDQCGDENGPHPLYMDVLGSFHSGAWSVATGAPPPQVIR